VRDFNLMEDLSSQDRMMIVDRAHREADDIKKKPSQRRGRTDQEILEDCIRGQAAEVFMISKYNYKDDPRKYKDTFNLQQKSVDQKVIGYEDPKWILNKCKEYVELAEHAFRKFPHIIQVWYNKKDTNDYIWKGEYHYEGISKGFTRVC